MAETLSRRNGRFLTTLKSEDLPGHWIRLLKPLRYRSASGLTFVVPASFICDMTSSWLKRRGDHDVAAVLHDWLYFHGAMGRAEADALYFEAMRALEVPLHRAYCFYLAVRLGGWRAWEKHRARDRRNDDLLAS